MAYDEIHNEKYATWVYIYWRDFVIELKCTVIRFWSRKARRYFIKAYNKYVEILKFLKDLESEIW